jgi:phosphatidylglycerophosphatase GEP4
MINLPALRSLAHAIRHRDTLLRPALRLSSVAELPARLAQLHVAAVVLDVDNTLTMPYAQRAASPDVLLALQLLRQRLRADRVALLSNHAGSRDDAAGARADALERALGCAVIRHESKKPALALGDAVLRHFGSRVPLRRIALVGDRLLTDVYFANCVGMCAVLVSPIDAAADPWLVRVARRFETAALDAQR